MPQTVVFPAESRLSSDPPHADAAFQVGVRLQAMNRNAEAANQYRQALALRPNWAEAHNNLGVLLDAEGDVAGAAAHLRQAAGLRPDYVDAFANLGNLLRRQRQLRAAIACYDHAITLDSDQADLHWNRGIALLTEGRLREGFAEYEWGLRCGLRTPHSSNLPRWDGSDLPGGSILVHAEQGFGDTLQFVRYLPLVKARVGRVVLEVQPALAGLLARVEGADEIVPAGSGSAEGCDTCISLMSLPAVFGTEIETIPEPNHYVAPTAARTQAWAGKFAHLHGLRVGIVWAGNPVHRNDRNRSMFLTDLMPLADVAGISLASLQTGLASHELNSTSAHIPIYPAHTDLHNFEDTAAAIASLDLVITVDTAVAHLAGAMGKPVWTLLPWMPDWRWMLDREDSPWYPTMRLFRQETPGEWSCVVDNVCREIEKTEIMARTMSGAPQGNGNLRLPR